MAAWRALAGAEVIGEANAMLRPDRRWFVSIDTWLPDSFPSLVSAVADDLRQDLYTTQNFDERRFDPATYLVAVDDASQAFAGLARVWKHRRQPRLGLVGVTPGYRRRGLAKLLLAAVFAPLCERGISEVAAEADAADPAANALLARIGARRVGGSLELVRRVPPLAGTV